MNREDLEEMTATQLREHAEVAGVTLGSQDTKGTMVDKILGEYKAPERKKNAEDTREIPLGALYDLQGNKINAPVYRVKIFGSENDKSDVDIVVNGHNIRVQRGVEVLMSEPYVQVLENAVIQTITKDPDTGIETPFEVPCYPHTARRI